MEIGPIVSPQLTSHPPLSVRRRVPTDDENPFKNAHNTHEMGIQDSMKQNLCYLISYRPDVPPLEDLCRTIYYNILDEETFWFCTCSSNNSSWTLAIQMDTELRLRLIHPYPIHGFTAVAVIDRLWIRIMDFPLKIRKQVQRRFMEEVIDSTDHCMNGFMVRMSNVLVGFDKNIKIALRPAEVLQSRIPATMNRFKRSAPVSSSSSGTGLVDLDEIVYWKNVLLQTWSDMEEMEMPLDERLPWIQPFLEPFLISASHHTSDLEHYMKQHQIPQILLPFFKEELEIFQKQTQT
jgi:hypothetical protein